MYINLVVSRVINWIGIPGSGVEVAGVMKGFRRTGAVLLVLVVVLSTAAAQGVFAVTAFGSTNTNTNTSTAQTANTLAECQEINSSGTYVLGDDMTTSNSTCFEFSADDVTIDGNGHEIQASSWESGSTAVVAEDQENVTVRDVGFQNWGEAVRFNTVDGQIQNVTTRPTDADSGEPTDILLKGKSNVTVADSHVDYLLVKTILGPVDLHATNNTIESGLSLNGATGTVENNTMPSAQLGTGTHDIVFRYNDVTDGGLTVRGGDNITITRNHISGPTANDDAVTLVNVGENFHLAGNVLENATNGVRISGNEGSIFVRENHIDEVSTGILIENVGTAERKNATELGCGFTQQVTNISIHQNAITPTGTLGIDNQADGWVDATRNYWGDSDGPSSPNSTTLQDPVTGRSADGGGAAVSVWDENPDYTNVHFDTPLRQSHAGVPNADEVGRQTA